MVDSSSHVAMDDGQSDQIKISSGISFPACSQRCWSTRKAISTCNRLSISGMLIANRLELRNKKYQMYSR
jgi:hypothetical protein